MNEEAVNEHALNEHAVNEHAINEHAINEHAASFGRAAGAYERGRPPYPPEIVTWAIPAGARRVLDLGAGTGKLTRQIVDTDREVVAVEPSARMREQLTAAVPGVEVRDGTAERIPLPDASVDAVVAAQAWHWADPVRAVPEVARVLKPGGTLGLIWNIRDHTEEWVARLDGILHRHTRLEIDTSPVAGAPFGPPERTEIRWRHALTRAALLDMVASRSYVIVLPEPERRELLTAVERLIGDQDQISLPYVTVGSRFRSSV